jgi:molecular chaperone DnaK
MGRIIGIDLGTSWSRVAVMDRGRPRMIPSRDGATATPSIVAWAAGGEPLVGDSARRLAATSPEHAVSAIVRLVGRKLDRAVLEEAGRFLPFRLAGAPNGDLRFVIEGECVSPPEVAAVLLRELRACAEEDLGDPVAEAIVAVPSSFDDLQRQAVRDAARIAGLACRLVNGSTAAALSYSLGSGRQCGSIAVCDLGGGTLDVSIVDLADGLVQVRATGGDAFLGGLDFDRLVIEWLAGELRKDAVLPADPDACALRKLGDSVESAKRELSIALRAEIALPAPSGEAVASRELTRRQLERATAPLVERAANVCGRCLAEARLAQPVDDVLLLGGQSRAPLVVDAVTRAFGKPPSRAVSMDERVAMGASILAGIVEGEVEGLLLVDATAHTLGIETRDGTFTPLVERGSRIPTRKTRVFTTIHDNQTRVLVHVLQGESDLAAYNRSLQKFELVEIPRARRGEPQIDVAFGIDVNGTMSVEATDQATGRRQAIRVHPSGGLSPAEVDRLAEDARRGEVERRARRIALMGRTA